MRMVVDGREYIIDAPAAIAHLITNAYEKNGFRGFIIVGEQGAGKTVLSLWTLYLLFNDWDQAFEHIVFDWQDHLQKLEKWLEVNREKEQDYERYAALLYDDAAVQFNKYIFYVDKALAWSLSQYLQLIRRFTSAIIFTCVDEEELLRSIRSQPFIYVEVKRIREGLSAAFFYRPTKKPLGKRKTRVIGTFVFTPFLPGDIYARYQQLNISYTQRSPLLAKAREVIKRFREKIEKGEEAYVENI